ncbi:MAG: hypothetical protein PHQ96_01720 [Candidatus Omnitrophica bacterium]|nr:hypothetical protein [Candidatus Omnitrophota bacterium]
MNKKSDSIFPYTYIDSQRLRETFFSPQKKRELHKKKKNSHSKVIIVASAAAFLSLVALVAFGVKYDLLVIPRAHIKSDTSLLRNQGLYSSAVIKGGVAFKAKNSPLYLEIPAQGDIKLIISLKKPVNIAKTPLLLYLKKANSPLKMGVVARDSQFFSNSLNPFIIELKANMESSYTKIPIALADARLQNTNLSNINQITLYFYPPQENESTAINNWVVVKDLVLAEKGAK